MWDLPRPGIEPLSPTLAGGFSTTAPPGKSLEQRLHPPDSLLIQSHQNQALGLLSIPALTKVYQGKIFTIFSPLLLTYFNNAEQSL